MVNSVMTDKCLKCTPFNEKFLIITLIDNKNLLIQFTKIDCLFVIRIKAVVVVIIYMSNLYTIINYYKLFAIIKIKNYKIYFKVNKKVRKKKWKMYQIY